MDYREQDKEQCIDFLVKLEPFIKKIFWELEKKFFLSLVNTCDNISLTMILSGYINLGVIDMDLIRVGIDRISYYLKVNENKCFKLSLRNKTNSWESQ